MNDVHGDFEVRVSDQHADAFKRNTPVLLVEQTTGQRSNPVKYATWLPVSGELLADAAPAQSLIECMVDWHLRPWTRPDPGVFPHMDVVPWARLHSRASAAWREARRRVSDAWYTLRYGADHDGDDW